MVLYISHQTYDRFFYNYYVSVHLVDETSIQLPDEATRHQSNYQTRYETSFQLSDKLQQLSFLLSSSPLTCHLGLELHMDP
jgi:hypothetical protein